MYDPTQVSFSSPELVFTFLIPSFVSFLSLPLSVSIHLPHLQLSTDPNFSDWNFDSVFGFQSNSNHTKKNKTDKADKWADDTGVTIRSAKIFPNTWKPK